MDPCHIKSKIRRANFFYLCPQMHPRPYYVSHSNQAQCGMCGQPCSLDHGTPTLTGFGLGCFSTIIAHQSMDPCHIKSIVRGANFFYLCLQIHPRAYYVSHSNGAQCGMCGQPCSLDHGTPTLTGFGLGCFSTIIANQSIDPCHIKSKIRRANCFSLCPQMHPRPYYVSLSNGAQCGMCGQPC